MDDTLSPQPIADGELLRAFAAFAETLSFTHAAARIGLSQPALHERVGRLALHAGVPLYVREGRALRLTPAGERLAAYARDTLAQAGQVAAALAGTDAAAPARVVLAAGAGSYLYLLGPALRAFRGAHPLVDLEVRVLGGPSAARAVRTGEVHLAVGVYDIVPRDVEAHVVCTTGLCAALADSHPLAGAAALTLAELAGERLILAPQGQRQRALVSHAFARQGAAVQAPLEADGWPLMLAFAAAGLGVAVVNGTCQPPPGCRLVPLPELGILTYHLLRRSAAPQSAAVSLLIAFICTHAGGRE